MSDLLPKDTGRDSDAHRDSPELPWGMHPPLDNGDLHIPIRRFPYMTDDEAHCSPLRLLPDSLESNGDQPRHIEPRNTLDRKDNWPVPAEGPVNMEDFEHDEPSSGQHPAKARPEYTPADHNIKEVEAQRMVSHPGLKRTRNV